MHRALAVEERKMMYTIAEVAQKLKVNRLTVIKAITDQQLSATKVGRQWRISEDQLNEYLERRTIKARKLKSAI